MNSFTHAHRVLSYYQIYAPWPSRNVTEMCLLSFLSCNREFTMCELFFNPFPRTIQMNFKGWSKFYELGMFPRERKKMKHLICFSSVQFSTYISKRVTKQYDDTDRYNHNTIITSGSLERTFDPGFGVFVLICVLLQVL